ncbi:MAG: hypothetical protein LBD11_05420 [Candidatus Peribacteria bacterium]|jgi:hypothetical protein|nr:hypothetical protein [Candidatus Peribacteria bacterium]
MPTQYGGCLVNAQDGVNGRATLQSKGWTIDDGGLADCAITGMLTYNPSSATNQDVLATLTLNMTGSVMLSGWTTVNATTFTKLYTGNVSGEVVNFESVYGYTGVSFVIISRIDKTLPEITNLTYTPDTATSGNVEVSITLNEAGIITGRATAGNLTRTKIFDTNTGYTLTFSDIVGNTNTTGITINRIDKTAVT